MKPTRAAFAEDIARAFTDATVRTRDRGLTIQVSSEIEAGAIADGAIIVGLVVPEEAHETAEGHWEVRIFGFPREKRTQEVQR